MAGTKSSGGRNKKPAAVLKVHGTYRKDRHEGRGVDAPGTPERPSYLKGEGQELWDKLVPRLCALGVLSELDEWELVRLCESWQRYRSAVKSGETVGARKCSDEFGKIAARFGMNPVDRARLVVPGGAGNADEVKFFGT